MARQWTAQQILDFARTFQPACVLTAAASLDVFSTLHKKPTTSRALASGLGTSPRATTGLLDALTALGLLNQQDDNYSVPEDVAESLSAKSRNNVLPMVRHMANSLPRWARLAAVIQTGRPAECGPSIHGRASDQADFIGAMHATRFPGNRVQDFLAEMQPARRIVMVDFRK